MNRALERPQVRQHFGQALGSEFIQHCSSVRLPCSRVALRGDPCGLFRVSRDHNIEATNTTILDLGRTCAFARPGAAGSASFTVLANRFRPSVVGSADMIPTARKPGRLWHYRVNPSIDTLEELLVSHFLTRPAQPSREDVPCSSANTPRTTNISSPP